MNEDINSILKSLADRFCERKALECLACFLPVYFAINGLTDGWEDCLRGLKELRALSREDLTKEEADDVNTAINLIHRMLDNR